VTHLPTDTDRRTEDAEELARAIRSLPQAAAGPGFHSAVLARAAGAAARRRSLRRRLLSLSAAVCVVAVGLGAWRFEVVRLDAERAERRAALIEEHRRLAGELDELRALAGRRSSIRLGGDASTDLYIDLATVAAAAPAAAGAEPSSNPTRSHS
jgi:hypothetical protein